MNMYQQEQYMKQLDTIAVPGLEIEQAILEGQHRAEKEKRIVRLQKLKKGLIGITATACLILALLVGIRVSPVFASTLSQIPVVSELVALIAGNKDKGLQDIVDNEYYEVIDQTVTENGLSLTLKGVIADESGMIIYYSVTAEEPEVLKGLSVNRVRIYKDEKEFGDGYGSSFFYREGDVAIEDEIDVHSNEKLDYSSKQFAFNVTFSDEHETVITIPFELKQPIAITKSHSIAKEVVVNGQKIWLDELNISPLRAELKLHADKNNSMRLLAVRSLELIDEMGEQWGAINNGITATGTFDEKGYSLYIQSNYFRDPKQLTLRLGEIEALPRGEDYIEVDFEQQKVLYQPSLIEGDISVTNDSIIYIGTVEIGELTQGNMFASGVDAKGEMVYRGFGTMHSGEEYYTHDQFELEGFTNPIRLPIVSYPNFLPDSIEVEIPLTE